jgi:hypothetical protein
VSFTRPITGIRSSFAAVYLGVVAVAIVSVGWAVAAYVAALPYSFTIPYTREYAEGYVLHHATHWTHLYTPIEQIPYMVTNYPPLYYVLTGLLNAVVPSPFYAGRIISVVSSIGTALLLALLVRAYAGDDRRVLLGPWLAFGLFLGAPAVQAWGTVARVDLLGVFLSVAALYWYVTYAGPRRRQMLGAGCLCLLALYTKQSYVWAPAAIFFTELWHRRLRAATSFAVGLSATGLGILGSLSVLTDGRIWRHLVTYNSNAYSVGRARVWLLEKFFPVHFPLLVIGIAMVTLIATRRYRRGGWRQGAGTHRQGDGTTSCTDWQNGSNLLSPVLVVYLAGGVANAIMVGKFGGWVNYFVHLNAALALATGVLTVEVIRMADRKRAIVLGVVLFGAVALQGALFYQPAGYTDASDLAEADNAPPAVARLIDQADDPVLSSDPGLLVHNRQDVVYKPSLFAQLQREGKWNGRNLRGQLRSGEFDYVVLRFPIDDANHPRRGWGWTDTQLQLLNRHYRLTEQVGSYWVYAPKSGGGHL